jgi:hypothetical protein
VTDSTLAGLIAAQARYVWPVLACVAIIMAAFGFALWRLSRPEP